MLIYSLIFLAKIIENCLSTLRIILVANGKKIIGAVLQGIITLIWLFSASSVLSNINSLFKVLFFVLGSIIGSYLGSILEEKLAFGNNLITVILDKSKGHYLIDILKDKYFTNVLDESNNIITLTIMVSRKKREKLISLIKLLDDNCIIYSLKILIS